MLLIDGRRAARSLVPLVVVLSVPGVVTLVAAFSFASSSMVSCSAVLRAEGHVWTLHALVGESASTLAAGALMRELYLVPCQLL
jgi:hypothetical protein